MKKLTQLLLGALLVGQFICWPAAVGLAAGPEGRNPDNHFVPATIVPITQNSADFTLPSTYTVPACNAGYYDTGLTMPLSPAGTYLIWYQARTNINASSGVGAYILTELYNVTDGTAVPYSQMIGAYASTLGAAYYGTATIFKRVTIAAPKVINLYAACVAPGTVPVKTVNSDSNGWVGSGYVQVY